MNWKNLSIEQLTNLEASICKESLYEFVKRSWPIVESGNKFTPGWHIESICNYLESTTRGEIRNLIINIPPRCMKSLLVNVFFPAWVWTKSPEKKFMCISNTDSLATGDSMLCRKLIESIWYKERFPVKLSRDNNQKTQFENTDGGYRISFGLAGAITGEGADFVLIDDPLKASELASETSLNNVNFIYDNSIVSRLNNPKTGVKILIMQRLNENDLVGHLLQSKEEWETLILPMEYEGQRFISSIGFTDPRKEEGELLWPERFGEKEVKTLKESLGEIGTACQLQQRPTSLAGNIFKKEWFINREYPYESYGTFISWDTASSISETSAYSSAIVGELTPDYRLFIREVYRDRLQFPQLIDAVEGLAKKYIKSLKAVIVENKSSGIQVVQSLSQLSNPEISEKIFPYLPSTDKLSRAISACLFCENGSVILPPPSSDYLWLYDFEEELFSFPNGKYKDQIDSFSQLILFLKHYLSEGYQLRRK